MNLKIKNLNFKIIYCIVFFLSFSAFSVFAQNADLYAYIIIQEDDNIGSPVDKVAIEDLLEDIQLKVPSMRVHMKFMKDTEASKVKINAELQNATIDDNDVVWIYYSGHGRNYNTWPQTEEQEIPLTWVHNRLKETDARLTLAMYDCCNYLAPLADPPSDINPKSAYYKILFLESEGNIISASCSSTQMSYGNPNSGGVYTNSFIDAIKSEADWNSVFAATKRMTTENARERNRTQIPIVDIQIDTIVPIPAPSLKTKWFATLEEMAEQMQKSCKASGINVAIDVKDIKRWNPSVTETNFKDFKKLEFNPNDPDLKKTD